MDQLVTITSQQLNISDRMKTVKLQWKQREKDVCPSLLMLLGMSEVIEASGVENGERMVPEF